MPINKEGLQRLVDQSFGKIDITTNTQNKSIEFPKSNNNIDDYEAFHSKLAGLHMDVPAFSGMLVNDEIGTAILNYKYNNNLLTDTNTVYILTNDNAVIPTGDPGLKPIELLSWAKDFKSSSVPYRIPGFSSQDSKSDPTAIMPASNPINCGGKSFDEIISAVKRNMGNLTSLVDIYADKFYDKVKQYYGYNKQAFIDNIYTIIYRESKGFPYLSNTRNSNGTWDCGLMQINTRYAKNDLFLLQKYNKSVYNDLKNRYPKEINTLLNSTDKSEICNVLKNPDINLALALALLTANLNNYGSIIDGNLAYGGYSLVKNKRFISLDANCIFRKYLQKYPDFDKNHIFKG